MVIRRFIMAASRKIFGGHILTPTRVIENGTIVIQGERIVDILSHSINSFSDDDIDASGTFVLPGLIDTHSDAIETEMQPRPSSQFPLDLSFYELEKKLASQGITTIYHSLSLYDANAENWARKNDVVLYMIKQMKKWSKERHLIRHKFHLRLEINNIEAIDHVKQLLQQKEIDQLSFMDHSPNQGQFQDDNVYRRYLMQHRHMNESEAELFMMKKKEAKRISSESLQQLADLAYENNIPLASHDDDSFEKLMQVKRWRAKISEFPISLDVAKKAKEMGLLVVMGAPNVLLGGSHSKNLSAKTALEQQTVDILCSDYHPSSLLHALFLLEREGFDFVEIVNKATFNPAKALGIDAHIGSLEVGKQADLIIVKKINERPVIEMVMVEGNIACQMNPIYYH